MPAQAMKIAIPHIERICDEAAVIAELPLDGARVLELGCGRAEKTRALAQGGRVASILALEVDEKQHAVNQALTGLAKVQFGLGGAERIPAADASMDIIFMFKSLHHVPLDLLDQAFSEMQRVLVPGGLAYLSEPIFGGDYNEIMRLFHDEERVREAAFAAIQRAVASSRMTLVSQTFFKSPMRFRNFAQFEEKVLKVTHTNHQISPELHDRIREKFNAHMGENGAPFQVPMRVDLLRNAG